LISKGDVRLKEVTRFQCEICNCEYKNPTDALKCESRGIEKPLLDVGKEIYEDFRIKQIKISGHDIHYILDYYDSDLEDWECGHEIYCNDELLNIYKWE
jgi:ribosomal protein L40E